MLERYATGLNPSAARPKRPTNTIDEFLAVDGTARWLCQTLTQSRGQIAAKRSPDEVFEYFWYLTCYWTDPCFFPHQQTM